jgi:uncharacterized membrane protein
MNDRHTADTSTPEHTATAAETIALISELERRANEDRSPHQREVEALTAKIGRPRTLYLIVTFVILWIAANVYLTTIHRAFDPLPFSVLQGILQFSALLMTILIVTTQNRQNQHDTRRDQLDLQINLLTERRVAKVIEMLESIRRDSPGVPNRDDPEATELREVTDPNAVVRSLNEQATD